MSVATISIRLGDADRARLGIEQEWLDIDLLTVTAREAMLLQQGVDLGDGLVVQFDTPAAWRVALGGEVILDRATGEPVTVERTLPDGTVETTPKRRPDFGAELVTVWLALRHSGIHIALTDLDYDPAELDWRAAEVDPGKGDPSTPPTISDS